MVERGYVKQLGKKYYISPTSIYQYERNGRLLEGKYEVKLIGAEGPKIVSPDDKPMTFDENIDEIARRLRIYGNTTLPRIKNGELQTYLDSLKEKGYPCDVKAYSVRSGNEITLEGSPFDKSRYDTNYIVTRRKE